MLFRGIIAAYCENRAEHVNTSRVHALWMLKQVVHIVTTVNQAQDSTALCLYPGMSQQVAGKLGAAAVRSTAPICVGGNTEAHPYPS
jgi:hypothetical protein